ncbi:MAG: DUF3332 family protein [Candidatus Omnitrophica bacterium]|nr:DUF3332 family protein [Candidatus Omnitrophota bacterium]MBV6482184.1 hypothetical protein [bacterium]MBW7937398.1 DUF3332 family protein [Candidatus Omnitrophota bacterium]MCC6733896.1 DUF3332 family protein [Candidatus Omnitrophota bacterium]MCK6497685.1 DUF3332 domain-containing protein [bacterium]
MFHTTRKPGEFWGWIRSSRISLFFVFLLIPTLPMLGCYGEFVLTKQLYEFNGDISTNGFVQSLVMWVLSCFFIYSIAVVVDAAILNLIEFWTGDNPALAKSTFQNPDGSQVVMTPLNEGKDLQVDMVRDGKVYDSRQMIRTSSTHFDIYNNEGQMVGGVDRGTDGGLTLTRSDNSKQYHLSPEDIQGFKGKVLASM